MEGYLVLEDGTSFSGELDGLDGCTGEVVFFTGMTGYQEVLTDPSYNRNMRIAFPKGAVFVLSGNLCRIVFQLARSRNAVLLFRQSGIQRPLCPDMRISGQRGR